MSDSAAPRDRARLVALDGDSAGTAYDLESEETMIGRNPGMNIALVDDGISREHAMISYEEAACEYVVEDLRSTNGTKVNGKRVRSAALTSGDELRIGNTSFRFEIGTQNPG